MSATCLTLLATTDIHGYVTGFDHVIDGPFADFGHAFGMARVATIVDRVRSQRRDGSVIVVDCGDSLVGSPLVDPEGLTAHDTHPMAVAFNHIGYDAATIGNHDLDHGLDALSAFARQLGHPLLAANLLGRDGRPLLASSAILDRTCGGARVRVGIVGVTTPGSAIWNQQHLAGQAVLGDMVTAADEQVRLLRSAGVDVVVILAHSGLSGTSYRRGDGPPENDGEALAALPGVDVVVLGHSHQHQPGRREVRGDGSEVLIVQPRYWGSSVIEVTLTCEVVDGQVRIVERGSRAHAAYGVAEDRALVDAVRDLDERTRSRLAQPLGRCPQRLECATAPWHPNRLLGMVALAQRDRARELLADAGISGMSLLSVVSPLSRTAVFESGEIRLRHVRALYPYPNRLRVVKLTGAQVREYLEWAARYFADAHPGDAFDQVAMTSATRDGVTLWDFLYDQVAGVRYTIDLAQPVGSRVTSLQHGDGSPVVDDERFAVAVDHYRAAGGGGYPHLATAPLLATDRELIVDVVARWLTAQATWEPDEWDVIGAELQIAGQPI